MKCPYCNRILKPLMDWVGLERAIYTCLNPKCNKSIGMIGTEDMWVKVGNLAKIREAGDRYRKTHKRERSVYMHEYYIKKKEQQCS